MKKIFFYLILAVILVIPLIALTPKILAQEAANPSDIGGLDKSGELLNQAAGQAGYPKGQDKVEFALVVGNVILYLLGLLGVIFFILIVYGGVIWMTAGGNEQYIEKAQKIIKNAAGGIVVIFLAGVITWFVLNVLFQST